MVEVAWVAVVVAAVSRVRAAVVAVARARRMSAVRMFTSGLLTGVRKRRGAATPDDHEASQRSPQHASSSAPVCPE
ncbi:hypothetical protein GCM10010397_75640 [Streptomyces spinoverrucosus]|nr:hypothetical protein GCM10010397_75640 [Streptomyces spinoverrucosus]